MEQERFDSLTRLLAQRQHRRGVASLLVAAIAAGVGGLPWQSERAAAKNGKGGKGKKCDKGQTRCEKACVDLQQDNGHCGSCGKACTTGGTCCCAGVCTDTGSDRQNCGSCGNVCGEGLVCSNGTCDKQCPGSQRLCAGACVNVDTDIKHCGSCDNVCAENERCQNGKCVCPSPICPKPNSDATRCCPAAGGTCCDTGFCCAPGSTCAPDFKCNFN